ncbi:uncharacterized protein [Cicer arietinum]|uniref:uncharacterized protein n=1 Tax=Cicer arietinum TaxID=3827 RepID=UPI000640FF14
MGLKSGKIASGYTGLNNTKKLPAGANKKKEEESHFVASNPANPSFVRRPYAAATSQISGTLNQHSKGYDSNAVCDYHSGAVGHSTENCLALKFKVHDLLKAGWLNFKENEPSVKNNPLPVHGGPIVNAIEENHQVIREVEKIKAPMGLIFSELCKFGLIQGNADVKARCNFHLNEDHSIEECNEFKKELQKLINIGTIQIGRWEKDDGMIATQSEEKLGITIPKPLVIHFTKEESMNAPGDLRTLIVQIPSPFAYKDNKAVPWNYNVEVHLAKQKDKDVSSSKTTAVTNVSGIGMTRNDRICSPGKSQREMRVVFEKAYTDKKEKKVEKEKVENEVSNEEAQEFLKIIKQREGDSFVSNLSTTPYVETTKDALETAFQTLEIVDTAYVETTPIEPHMSNTAIMVAKFMLSRGHHPWHGLGKDEEGLREPVELPENRDKWGLGYKPTRDDKRRLVKEKKEKRLARIENREPRIERIPICDIRRSFQSARPTSEIHIAAAEDDMFDGDANWIRPCGVGAEIRNWKVVKSPMIFNAIPIFGNSSFTDECTKISLHNLNHLVSQTEKDNEEDYEPPLDLLKAVEREAQGIMPFEEPIEIVNLGTEEGRKEIKVGTILKKEVYHKLIQLLHEYKDVFAWSYQDMPGLDTSIVEHKLSLKPDSSPVKQKLRRMKPDMSLKIRDEIQKQFDAGFLAVANYPQWIANIVPVPKKDGKVRMYVDYRDLNKASPKDDFPLPHIDILVDNTARHSLFSFMDGFFGYNQIKMAAEDMEKTTFTTPWGTFCYKVMPFGLKNAGATYQRAMVTLFHDMIHKEPANEGT